MHYIIIMQTNTCVHTFALLVRDLAASIKIRSPIFSPRVSMVTSSTAGETARDEALDTVETVDTGERFPGNMGIEE